MRPHDKYPEKIKKGQFESPPKPQEIPHEKLKKGQIVKDYPKSIDNSNIHDSVKEDYRKSKPNYKPEINDHKETKNKQRTSFHDNKKEDLKDSKKPPVYNDDLLRSERTFADPLQQELQIRNSNKERSNRNSLDESQRPKISKPSSFDEIQKQNIINDHRNNKTKGALILSMILIKRSMKNSTINKKAQAFIKWIKGIMIQERELMNNEFNDLNILLSEMVCRENQRIMGLRLKKNDMDSRINVLNQMLTCLKVNVFQKNIKKLKV